LDGVDGGDAALRRMMADLGAGPLAFV